MATTNVNTNNCFGQLSNNGLNYHANSCKIEASHPHLQARHFPEACHRNDAEVHRILISNNTYYGHHASPSQPENVEVIKPMDCEMMPISTHIPQTHSSPLGRKRSGDDISFANIKRLKQEEYKMRSLKKDGPNHTSEKQKENDSLLYEELLEGIHGCPMFHMLQEAL